MAGLNQFFNTADDLENELAAGTIAANMLVGLDSSGDLVLGTDPSVTSIEYYNQQAALVGGVLVTPNVVVTEPAAGWKPGFVGGLGTHLDIDDDDGQLIRINENVRLLYGTTTSVDVPNTWRVTFGIGESFRSYRNISGSDQNGVTVNTDFDNRSVWISEFGVTSVILSNDAPVTLNASDLHKLASTSADRTAGIVRFQMIPLPSSSQPLQTAQQQIDNLNEIRRAFGLTETSASGGATTYTQGTNIGHFSLTFAVSGGGSAHLRTNNATDNVVLTNPTFTGTLGPATAATVNGTMVVTSLDSAITGIPDAATGIVLMNIFDEAARETDDVVLAAGENITITNSDNVFTFSSGSPVITLTATGQSITPGTIARVADNVMYYNATDETITGVTTSTSFSSPTWLRAGDGTRFIALSASANGNSTISAHNGINLTISDGTVRQYLNTSNSAQTISFNASSQVSSPTPVGADQFAGFTLANNWLRIGVPTTKAEVDSALGTAAADDTFFYRGDGTFAAVTGGSAVITLTATAQDVPAGAIARAGNLEFWANVSGTPNTGVTTSTTFAEGTTWSRVGNPPQLNIYGDTASRNADTTTVWAVGDIALVEAGPTEVYMYTGTPGAGGSTDDDWLAIHDSNTDVDVSVANLKTRLAEGFPANAVSIGDSNDVVTIPGSLVVTGSTTTSHVNQVSTSNGVVFEGNTADANEITLIAGAVTADRTIVLPDAAGTIALTSNLTEYSGLTAAGFYTVPRRDAGATTTKFLREDGDWIEPDVAVEAYTSFALRNAATRNWEVGDIAFVTVNNTSYFYTGTPGVGPTMTSDWTQIGTLTNLTVGTGLDATSTSTQPNITLDLSEFADMTATINRDEDELILLDNGQERRKLISEISPSDFNTSDTTFVEEIQDIVGGMFTGNVTSNITIGYADATGKINVTGTAAANNAAITVTQGAGITVANGAFTANQATAIAPTIAVDATVVRTSGNQGILGLKTFGGNTLFGKTADDATTAGTRITSAGVIEAVGDSGPVAKLDRTTTTGTVLELAQAGTTHGVLGVSDILGTTSVDGITIGGGSTGSNGPVILQGTEIALAGTAATAPTLTNANDDSTKIVTSAFLRNMLETAGIVLGDDVEIGNQNATTGLSLWTGTQAAYDAITTKDATTLYFTT